MRWLREASEPRKLAQARKEGRVDAFRIVRISLLEVGDKPLTGFTAAELIRKLGLD